MANILEAVMIICFGLSWPINILKSLRAKTAKGKSVLFLILIQFGCICGIVSKIILMATGTEVALWVFLIYILNFLLVFADFMLYFRNRRLDEMRAKRNR